MVEIKKTSIKKLSLEEYVLLAFFALSLIHAYIWVVFSALVFLFLIQGKTVVGIKGVILYIIRIASLNTKLAASIASISVMRYVFLLLFAFALMIITKPSPMDRKTLRSIGVWLFVFFVYASTCAAFNSSYPIVSAMKCFLYVVVFFSILKGISSTSEFYDWKDFLYKVFSVIFILSALVIPIMSLRTKNGRAFQGILIHPNTFGIVAAIAVAFFCMDRRRSRHFNRAMIVAVLFMQYLSESRTGLFSSILIIGVYYLVENRKHLNKIVMTIIIILIIVAFVVAVLPQVAGSLSSKIVKFLYKGNDDNLFYSRSGHIRTFEEKIHAHPLFGTGFMTPYVPGLHSFSFDFDMYVEQSNVVMAVLGELGIFGFLLWIMMCLYWLSRGNKNYLHLFLTPFIVSSGEMVFFSSNSVGALLFVCFAIYMFDKDFHNNPEQIET